MALSNMFGPSRTLIDSDYRRIGKDLITPFNGEQVQPASYDVTLGGKILVPLAGPSYSSHGNKSVDLRRMAPKQLMKEEFIGNGYSLEPGLCALVATREQISCPHDMLASVDGKSTLGRCFLAVHVTAGFIDPGYVGAVTLELVNHSPWDFVLYEGMKIGQLRFQWLGMNVEKGYGSPGLGSHYQGSTEVRPAQGDVT